VKTQTQSTKYEYGNLVVRKALEASGGAGVSLEASKAAIEDALVALSRQAKALAETDYSNLKGDVLGRVFSHTAKALDEIYRLNSFARGGADSRPDLIGIESILSELSDFQLDAVIAKAEAAYELAGNQKAIEAELVSQPET
jgi:hypothetical protein